MRSDYCQIIPLEIILNETSLNQFAAKYPAADGDQGPGIWVNIIAHVLARNFGHQHGSSGVWIRDYSGCQER